MSISPLGTAPKFKTPIKGLEANQRVIAEMVHRKPVLTFSLVGQYVLNAADVVLFGEEAANALSNGLARIENLEIDFHVQIDPKKIRPEHNNRIQAIRDRLNAAQQTTEKVLKASGQLGKDVKIGVTRADLPDTEILMELYEELDRALDARLLAVVMQNQAGMTLWDYVNENGDHVNLTPELLASDLHFSEAIHGAFQEWYVPTKASSVATTSAKAEGGTGALTSTTPKALPSDSDTHYIAPVSNGQGAGEASSPNGMNQ